MLTQWDKNCSKGSARLVIENNFFSVIFLPICLIDNMIVLKKRAFVHYFTLLCSAGEWNDTQLFL